MGICLRIYIRNFKNCPLSKLGRTTEANMKESVALNSFLKMMQA